MLSGLVGLVGLESFCIIAFCWAALSCWNLLVEASSVTRTTKEKDGVSCKLYRAGARAVVLANFSSGGPRVNPNVLFAYPFVLDNDGDLEVLQSRARADTL